jgi:selenium metabolism protein YedF
MEKNCSEKIGGIFMGEPTKHVDARGLTCPQPVLYTKQALDNMETGIVVTIVDNEIAKENILKLAKRFSCQVNITQQANDYYIEIQKGVTNYTEPDISRTLAVDSAYDTMILITREFLGAGSDELGALLMKSYLYTLTASDQLPSAVILINGGVKLAVEGSAVLDHLHLLDGKGVDILACGTCLDYYHLKDKLMVGTVTNMYSILEWMNASGKVITL